MNSPGVGLGRGTGRDGVVVTDVGDVVTGGAVAARWPWAVEADPPGMVRVTTSAAVTPAMTSAPTTIPTPAPKLVSSIRR